MLRRRLLAGLGVLAGLTGVQRPPSDPASSSAKGSATVTRDYSVDVESYQTDSESGVEVVVENHGTRQIAPSVTLDVGDFYEGSVPVEPVPPGESRRGGVARSPPASIPSSVRIRVTFD